MTISKNILVQFLVREIKNIISIAKTIVYVFGKKLLKIISNSNKILVQSQDLKLGLILDYSKDEIVKLVNLFYKTEFNQWNKNRTSYTPIENDAGCYIDIIKVTKRTIRLTISCGC
jgi:hypothetical protein